MPDLPTITITQAQMDLVTASFPGATTAEKVANYKNWLTNRVLDVVEEHQMRVAQANIQSSLPARPPEPQLL